MSVNVCVCLCVYRDYVCKAADPLGHLYLILYLVIKVNGKKTTIRYISTTKVTYPSGMKVEVTYLGTYPRPYEVLAGGKRNKEYILEDGSSKYLLRPHDHCRNENFN